MATFMRIADNQLINLDDVCMVHKFEPCADAEDGPSWGVLHIDWRDGTEKNLRAPGYDIEGIWEALMRLVLPSRDVPEMARREARREPTEAERIAMCKGT